MIAAWMLFSVVTGLGLTVAALAAERVAAALGRPRRFVWAAALAATSIWPAVARVWSRPEPGGGGPARPAALAPGVRRLGAFVVPAGGGRSPGAWTGRCSRRGAPSPRSRSSA